MESFLWHGPFLRLRRDGDKEIFRDDRIKHEVESAALLRGLQGMSWQRSADFTPMPCRHEPAVVEL
jgi:hypothetical protein